MNGGEHRAGPAHSPDPTTWPTGRLLSAAARRVERAWDAYLERWSLTHASLPVLAVLAAGPRSQRELARELGVTEQSTSRMLAGLERSGYVRRERHHGDRRRQVVAITPAGVAALTALNDADAVERLAVTGLDPAEAARLRALLLKLHRAGPAEP